MDKTENPLREIRKLRGFSVSKLARLAEITERTVYNIEGGSHANMETLRKMAKALNVNVEELIPLEIKEDVNDSISDTAERLIEEELSRFPQIDLTPEQKRRLIEIARKHLRAAIPVFAESLMEAM